MFSRTNIQFRGEISILQQSHIRNNWNTTAATIMSDNALGQESIKLVVDIDRETTFCLPVVSQRGQTLVETRLDTMFSTT